MRGRDVSVLWLVSVEYDENSVIVRKIDEIKEALVWLAEQMR